MRAFKYSKIFILSFFTLFLIIKILFNFDVTKCELKEIENNQPENNITIATSACGFDVFDQSMAFLKSIAMFSRTNLHIIILCDALIEDIKEEVFHF